MANSLAEFDSFKMRYKNTQVHTRIQQYISQGLEEFSLCRKKNISTQEKHRLTVAEPKALNLDEFEKSESQFLHQMAKLRSALINYDHRKVNEIYLINSVLTIMSNQKFKKMQKNYLKNSLRRL